ncbi:hypothetical protein HZS61_002227 [Fusarium oxysporum f. sp. conglutinans]|uniref:Zn(2)-C6 fungal-type domain-containing protein n=1 Tax=Fusarium oxysporum f. sp. conglutinans TaxID=100902 RepID=A0A8H6LFE5_FUSOX|nr:hypothetical protein HZS61_002227 [Fusarium oxysporum f. sp. conglutinans]
MISEASARSPPWPKSLARACLFCRARKIRCDTARPRCAACVIQKRECTYKVGTPNPRNLGEYREERVERITASTIDDLADECVKRGLHDREAFLSTIAEYNRAVYAHRKENPQMVWNPTVRDGLSTQSATIQLALATSNWALPIDKGPFLAVKVTCGITFTFGGLSVDSETAQVISSVTGKGVPGVYCVGEMIGGLFYSNYPGGSGLTSVAVFGRRAGRAAAQFAALSRRANPRPTAIKL